MALVILAIVRSVSLLLHLYLPSSIQGGQSMDIQMQIAIISASAALLGSLIGAIATVLSSWINDKLLSRGDVTLHIKIVYTKTSQLRDAVSSGQQPNTWAFVNSKTEKIMIIPIMMDICNTCGKPRIIRDINFYAYRGINEVGVFTPIQEGRNNSSKVTFADNGVYTVVIPENTSQRYDMLFALKEKDMDSEEKEFDTLVLRYYDEKNKSHSYKVQSIRDSWKIGELPRPRKWISLTKELPKNYTKHV